MKRILTVSIAIMAVSALSARAADAKETYEKDCLKCHGADGKGETKMGKKLMGPAEEGMSDADIKGLVAYMRKFKK